MEPPRSRPAHAPPPCRTSLGMSSEQPRGRPTGARRATHAARGRWRGPPPCADASPPRFGELATNARCALSDPRAIGAAFCSAIEGVPLVRLSGWQQRHAHDDRACRITVWYGRHRVREQPRVCVCTVCRGCGDLWDRYHAAPRGSAVRPVIVRACSKPQKKLIPHHTGRTGTRYW